MVITMKIRVMLNSERIKLAKKSMERAFPIYHTNRNTAIKCVDEEEMKQKLRCIKKYSIHNLDVLKRNTVLRLEKQNVRIYEVKNGKQAHRIIRKLIPKNETVVKSKSNTIDEIKLKEFLKKRGNRIVETDCGDFIVQLCDEKPSHPVTPAIHIPLSKIVKKIKEKYRKTVEKNPVKITEWIKGHLKEEILKAKIGLTGANAISADGGIFILENEGNISLVSRIPEKHIIIAGIDKIVPTVQDAITICQASAIWGTGSNLPTYINVISSPSKTADVQKRTVFGMHGTKEVHLLLVDNKRTEIIKQGFDELLYCINCGSCLYFCPIYRQLFDNYGSCYFGGRGVCMSFFQDGMREAFDNGLYFCTTCQACKENCPLEIDIPKLIRGIRNKVVLHNINTVANRKMIDNIEAVGNPFGEEVKEGARPKELYCC